MHIVAKTFEIYLIKNIFTFLHVLLSFLIYVIPMVFCLSEMMKYLCSNFGYHDSFRLCDLFDCGTRLGSCR